MTFVVPNRRVPQSLSMNTSQTAGSACPTLHPPAPLLCGGLPAGSPVLLTSAGIFLAATVVSVAAVVVAAAVAVAVVVVSVVVVAVVIVGVTSHAVFQCSLDA